MGYSDALGSVRLMPGRAAYRPSRLNLCAVLLLLKYPNPPPLKASKLQDVQDLIYLVPAGNSQYL